MTGQLHFRQTAFLFIAMLTKRTISSQHHRNYSESSLYKQLTIRNGKTFRKIVELVAVKGELHLEDTREEKADFLSYLWSLYPVVYAVLLHLTWVLWIGATPLLWNSGFSSVSGCILSYGFFFEKEFRWFHFFIWGSWYSSCIVYMVYNFLSFLYSQIENSVRSVWITG